MKRVLAVLMALCLLCGMGLAEMETGDIVTFGNYEQDNDTSNGSEPISWIVLKIDTEGGKALLISERGLDARGYQDDETPASYYPGWDKSDIRAWLNDKFLNAAFTAEEQAQIVDTAVSTPDNAVWMEISEEYDVDNVSACLGGEDCTDKVFLLSSEEAFEFSGLDIFGDFYMDGVELLKVVPTAYALEHNAWQYTGDFDECTKDGEGCGWWWLRSPGRNSFEAAIIGATGGVSTVEVDRIIGCVRPAVWVSMDALK